LPQPEPLCSPLWAPSLNTSRNGRPPNSPRSPKPTRDTFTSAAGFCLATAHGDPPPIPSKKNYH
jgi:hypothetical protein